jgi:hypothetical protein
VVNSVGMDILVVVQFVWEVVVSSWTGPVFYLLVVVPIAAELAR